MVVDPAREAARAPAAGAFAAGATGPPRFINRVKYGHKADLLGTFRNAITQQAYLPTVSGLNVLWA